MEYENLFRKYLSRFAYWNDVSMEEFLSLDESLSQKKFFDFRRWLKSPINQTAIHIILKEMSEEVLFLKNQSISAFNKERENTKARLPRIEDFDHVGMVGVSKRNFRNIDFTY